MFIRHISNNRSVGKNAKVEKTSSFNICVSPQLPPVLDNHSKGIDIHFWVRVVSSASDKLKEVRPGSQLNSKVHRLLFLVVRKQLLPLVLAFYANTDSRGTLSSAYKEG